MSAVDWKQVVRWVLLGYWCWMVFAFSSAVAVGVLQ